MGDYISKGVLTVDEAADGFIVDVVTETRISDCNDLAQVLAPELVARIRSRLEHLKSIEFEWTPFVIGEGYSAEGLQQLRQGLKKLYEEIS